MSKKRKLFLNNIISTSTLASILVGLLLISSTIIAPFAYAAPPVTSIINSYTANTGLFSGPTGVAVDSFGFIYTLDTNNHRIEKFNNAHVFVKSWGSFGSFVGQLSSPNGIAVDSLGNVWVADTGNNRIQEFANNGTFLSTFGSAGSANGQVSNPTSIFIDSTNSIWVADQSNHRIQKFNAAGVFQSTFGSNGGGAGQFSNPYAVTFDKVGNLLVADTSNNRVQEFEISIPATAIKINCLPTVAPRWGIDPVVVSGSANSAAVGDTVTIDWGDGTPVTSEISIATDKTWGPVEHVYASSAIATNPNHVVAKLFSSTSVLKATSAAVNVTVHKHKTSLTLGVIAGSVPAGSATSFPATLKDADINAGILGETIHFNGTGVIGVSDKITNSQGLATGTGTAPSSIGTGWIVQPNFTGDSAYLAKVSAIKKYNTT